VALPKPVIDCMGFNVFLTEVSLYAKTAYLKNLKVKNENC
jgi:hypothetical protein